MDFLYWFHLAIIIWFFSIPAWPLEYLEYGVYLPLALSAVWLIFDGCPLSRMQTGLQDGDFIYSIIKPVIPNITKEQTTRLCNFGLLLITVISMLRLRGGTIFSFVF